jgi:hypothetical protein
MRSQRKGPSRAPSRCGRVGPRPERPSWQRVQPAAGPPRHVVERSLAWLVGYRRLPVRDERRGDILLGFLQLACALICRDCPKRWRP